MVFIPDPVKNLGQYFTPNFLAEFMVRLITYKEPKRILEPAAGTGVFLQALEKKYSNIIAIEIDQKLSSVSKIPIKIKNFFDYPIDEKFDVIIGNPPFIRWRNQPHHVRDDIKKRNFWNNKINALSDILQAFIFKSIDHLTERGELIFITPKFWLQTLHATNLRAYIIAHGYIDVLIDFNEKKIFPSVTSNLIIFKFIKSYPPPNQEIKMFTFLEKESISENELKYILQSLESLENDKQVTKIQGIEFHVTKHPTTNQSWNLFSEADMNFTHKVETSCKTNYDIKVTFQENKPSSMQFIPLISCLTNEQVNQYSLNKTDLQTCFIEEKKIFTLANLDSKDHPINKSRYVTIADIFQIGNGMVSGLDKAFWLKSNSNKHVLKNLNSKEVSLLKKVVKARFMEQYKVSKYATYIFIEKQDFLSESEFEKQCPNLYHILYPFKEELLERWSPKPVPWYVWSFPRNYRIFDSFKHKFYLPCKERFDNKGFIRVVYETGLILGVQDITVLGLYPWVKEQPQYLLAYLNSKILFKWLSIKGLKRGGVFQFSEHPLSSVPIRLINWNDQKEIEIHNIIVNLVQELLISDDDTKKEMIRNTIEEMITKLIFINTSVNIG